MPHKFSDGYLAMDPEFARWLNSLDDTPPEKEPEPMIPNINNAYEPDDQLTSEFGQVVLWLRQGNFDSDRIRTTPDKASRSVSYQGDIYVYKGMTWSESSNRYELEYSILEATTEVP